MNGDERFQVNEAVRRLKFVSDRLAELQALGHKPDFKPLDEFDSALSELKAIEESNKTATGDKLSKGLQREAYLVQNVGNLAKVVESTLVKESRAFFDGREPYLVKARAEMAACDPLIAKGFIVLLDGLQKRWVAMHRHYELAAKFHDIDSNFGQASLTVPFHTKAINDLWGSYLDAYLKYFQEAMARAELLKPEDALPRELR